MQGYLGNEYLALRKVSVRGMKTNGLFILSIADFEKRRKCLEFLYSPGAFPLCLEDNLREMYLTALTVAKNIW
jgi:hypothetical protein